jgi:hypothetical protein
MFLIDTPYAESMNSRNSIIVIALVFVLAACPATSGKDIEITEVRNTAKT